MTVQKHRRSLLSRADLLQVQVMAETATTQFLANQLGLQFKPSDDQQCPLIQTEISDPAIQQPVKLDTAKPKTAREKPKLWRLERREKTVQQSAEKDNNEFATPRGWSNRPKTAPAFHPLVSPRSLLPRLLHHLKHQRESHEVDVNAIIRKLGRGELLQHLPRAKRRSLGRHLHIIEDRHIHLTPYWLDQTLFANLLTTYLPDFASSYAILTEGSQVPLNLSADRQITEWTVPPENSVVIVFSDLGALSENPQDQVRCWLGLGYRLQRMGCKLIAVTPASPADCDPRLQNLFTLESWQPLRQLSKRTWAERLGQATQLLTCLAPVIRLEPGLLRSVRLALVQQGLDFDAGMEAAVWQHPDLLEASSVAATFSSQARNRWLQDFKYLPDPVKQVVLEAVRRWRGSLREQIWFEEITSLDESAHQWIPQSDLNDAKHYFQHLSQRYTANEMEALADVDTQAWFRRLEKRLPQESWESPEVGKSLQRISVQIHRQDAVHRAGHPIDPANLMVSDLPIHTALLYQQGEYLGLGQGRDPAPNVLTGSPLAFLTFRRGLLYFELMADADQMPSKTANALQFQPDLAFWMTVCRLPVRGNLLIRSDEETLYFSQALRPDWASPFGRDPYGPYADLVLSNISQRFRWIGPGTFLMCSPEDEPEREPWNTGSETQHAVTLTQGYWLADTACTQALWKAVMNKNPAHFKDNENKPVEQVSWNDVQHFTGTLNRLIPSLNACLPTEAQWEYACRAGTDTPFSFGDTITPDQVNYNGEYPYADGEKGMDRQKPIPVKSLPPNPWGLYEMHGNVWEWCHDWYGDYLSEPSVDPVSSPEGVARVLRGGSWRHNGRYIRSAYRRRYEPDYRNNRIGFRLALGQQASTGQEIKPVIARATDAGGGQQK